MLSEWNTEYLITRRRRVLLFIRKICLHNKHTLPVPGRSSGSAKRKRPEVEPRGTRGREEAGRARANSQLSAVIDEGRVLRGIRSDGRTGRVPTCADVRPRGAVAAFAVSGTPCRAALTTSSLRSAAVWPQLATAHEHLSPLAADNIRNGVKLRLRSHFRPTDNSIMTILICKIHNR